MKRNFVKPEMSASYKAMRMTELHTHSAPITTDKPMSYTDLCEKVVVALKLGVRLSEARAYIREHAPSMSREQKAKLDGKMVYALAEGWNLTVYEVEKNATLSGLTIDRKESPRCYNQLQYMRDLLKGGNKSAKQRGGEKKSHTDWMAKAVEALSHLTPKQMAAAVAKATKAATK